MTTGGFAIATSRSSREAIEQALGLIETASSRSRILQARDALRAAAER
jgi:hypothetical protein